MTENKTKFESRAIWITFKASKGIADKKDAMRNSIGTSFNHSSWQDLRQWREKRDKIKV